MILNQVRRQRTARVCIPGLGWCLGILLAACPRAEAVPVFVKEAHHTTQVSRGKWLDQQLVLESRSLDSSSSLSDSLGFEPDWVNARAESALLRLSVFAAADFPLHDTSGATAGAEFAFSPGTDAVTPISIDFTGRGHYFLSYGHVSLVDVTTDSVLWDFDWDGFSGTVPWLDHTGEEPRGTAFLALNTPLLGSHDYRFSMFVGVGSQGPNLPHVEIQVSGFQVVPEPTACSLMALGAAAWLLERRRRPPVI